MTGFGKIGGLPGKELITLEQEFLAFVDFQLAVDSDTYNEYVKAILKFA